MLKKDNAPRMDCAVDATMSLIEGKWKSTVLCKLMVKGDMRFSELLSEVSIVSPKVLTNQLRELEKDGLISRTVYAEVPVRVVYGITERGKSLAPALKALADWALDNIFLNMVTFEKDIDTDIENTC
jgi:DNA-binding HxlR family transcriptional regulator